MAGRSARPGLSFARIWKMWLALSLALSAAGCAAYAAAHPRAQCWGASRWRLDGLPEDIALTFDDGPSSETPHFLDALEALGVKATFFVCGANVERYPDVARAIVDAGHAIGNHTFSHPCLPLCSRSRVHREIAATQDALASATGRTARLFRPPYGLRSPFLASALPAAGLTAVHWTIIGNDWKWGAERVTRRVLGRATGRDIICLHDGHATRANVDRSESLAALKEMAPRLLERGHRFVRIPGWEAGQ
ncbi:MAG: polysaccharide deacetylase family protein [Bryobacterales bacterium]|nr:polysaccharide deacetylase family protein [Bryobacterales bacterium]